MQPRVKCLLVDDLEENLVALSALLRRDDVELLRARSGAEALELLLVHDVALAFLDVQMPDMDGFELAELMRGSERTRHVPIIFVTAGTHDERRMFRGYDAGAVDFLHKPIDPRILRNKAEVFFQLYQQKQQLAHELRERTQTLRLNEMFTAVLGHDLRTPLTVILTSAELLLRLSGDEEAVRKSALRMMSSGKRMSRMIEDMLDLARARLAGGIPVKRVPVDFEPLVQRLVQEHQAAFPERRIEVDVEGDLAGHWDADRLAQAAANLLTNSLQHGSPGEAVRVVLDGTDETLVRLEVSNPGRIPPELLEHLFDPFRGSRPQAGRQGLGLGLYIVQQIVHAHHGTIAVSCDAGTRVCFRIEIPRRAVELV